MATQMFTHVDKKNGRRAHAAWLQDQTQTVMSDGTGRYAVGHLPEMEEDIDTFMAPDAWEWLEVEQEFYDPAYYQREN